MWNRPKPALRPTAEPGEPVRQVICMKWGAAYSAEDVNILYGMVARHTTGRLAFYCFTDDPSGIRREVACRPMPELGCEIPTGVPGKWRKVALWSRDLGGLQGPVLFVDLDSVIVDNIDGYFTFGDPTDVIVARNWVNRVRRTGQTSVLRFPVGHHAYMLDQLRRTPAEISTRYRFEQEYVTRRIRGGVKYWPEAWTRHFRLHCAGPWPIRFFRPPSLPRRSKIVTFPGSHPKPRDAASGRWSEGQAESLGQHLRMVWRCFREDDATWRRRFGHFLRPVPWVEQNWRA